MKAERDAALERALQAEKAIEDAHLIKLSEFVRRNDLLIHDSTDTSAHLKTGNRKATVTTLSDWTPNITLPQGFWAKLTRFEKNRTYRSERDVTQHNLPLLKAVLEGLEVSDHVQVLTELHYFDVKPDLTLVFGNNQVVGMSWEDKKGNQGNRLWESGTESAGQVYDQLAVNHVSLGAAVYGIQSTYNQVRLVSSHDFSNVALDRAATAEVATAGATEATTPDRPAVAKPDKKRRAKKTDVETFQNASKKEMKLMQEIDDGDRTFYASKVYSLGDEEQENRDYITLLATAILLAQQSVKIQDRDITKIPLRGPAREFNCNQRRIVNRGVSLKNGIMFDLHPTKAHKIFYAFKQIGYGGSAVCCLAAATSSAACVLKIFHQRGSEGEKLAAAEAANWKKIYRNSFDFVAAYEASNVHFLVLPFLHVSTCYTEREPLMKGDEKSPLWMALQKFASSGYSHEDIKWHHVGWMYQKTKKRKQNGEDSQEWPREVVLFDLGKVSQLEASRRDKWVKDTFEELKERHGAPDPE